MTDIVAVPPARPPKEFPAVGDPEFNRKAFDWAVEEVLLVTNLYAMAQAAYTNAVAAQERAVTAGQFAQAAAVDSDLAMSYRNQANLAAGTATTQAGIATGAAGTATAQAGLASSARSGAEDAQAGAVDAQEGAEDARDRAKEYRDQSEQFKDQAQIFATGQLKATSSASVVPGAGAKSFPVEPSRSFVVGMYLVATSVSDPATQMSGPVQSYDPATGALVIAVDKFAGAAARADWAIGIAARAGATALARQEVAASTVCVAGVEYIVVAPGITLTLPTNWRDDEEIAITEAIGNGAQYTLVFGGTKLRSQTMGTQVISAVFGSTGVLRHHNPAQGLV